MIPEQTLTSLSSKDWVIEATAQVSEENEIVRCEL